MNCSKTGCNKKVLARDMCSKHYEAARRAKEFEVYKRSDTCVCGKPAMKQATTCRKCAADNAERKNRQAGKQCSFEHCCSYRLYSKGYCQKHAQQIKRKGAALQFGRNESNEVKDEGDCVALVCRGTEGNITAIGLVDKDDKHKILQDKWHFDSSTGYIATKRKTATGHTKVYLHAHITERTPEGYVLDHRSGDKLDNRKSNYRFVTTSQNSMNSMQGINEKFSVPDVKGVHYAKSKDAYIAKIKVNGKVVQRQFKLLEDAVKYREHLAKTYHKEFAYENRPNEISSGV